MAFVPKTSYIAKRAAEANATVAGKTQTTPASVVSKAVSSNGTSWTPSINLNQNTQNAKPVDPIGANIKANPTYKSPAQVVTDAVKITSGGNDIKPKVDPVKTYDDGFKDATSKLEATNKSNLETWTSNETARQQADAEAIRAKVRAAVAQGTQAQNKIINDAPAQYVDPMNRASFQGANNARAIDERMMAMGLGRSGSNVTAQTSNNNQTSANINDLENTKAKVISDAQAAIANLQASGSLQEVAMVQEAAAKSLERLQAQQNLVEGRQNEQANLIYSNSLNALKTNYDIGANERQLGMQDKTIMQNQSNADRSFGLQKDTFNQGKDQWQQSFNQSGTQWDKSFNQNQSNADREYNYTLNKDRGYVNPTGGVAIPDEIRQQLSPYQDDYAQFAKDNAASNPKLAEYATALSNEKMFASPSLLKQFGQQTLQNQQVQSGIQTDAMQRVGLEISNKLNQLKLDAFPEEQQMSIETAKVALASGREDLAIKIIQKSQLPDEFKMKVAESAERISASKANTAQGQERLAIEWKNAKTAASKSSGSSEKFDSNRNMSIDDYNKAMESRFVKKEMDKNGFQTGNTTIDRQGAYNYLGSLAEALQAEGKDIRMVDELANAWGIKASDYNNQMSAEDMLKRIGKFFTGN
jgi:hypothetical protein